MSENRYRLVTRSDFDGVVCGVLLQELGMIRDIKFVHPKDMQDGTILIADTDISTNLPYVKGVHLAFDHHVSEMRRLSKIPDNYIVDPEAPSAARVVYRHFGGGDRFPNVSEVLLDAVDKGDSGRFTEDEVTNPQGWVLINFLLDARTGLGRYRDFRISNYEMIRNLVDACRTKDIDAILQMPDVAERVALYRRHDQPFRRQISEHVRRIGSIGVLDLRQAEAIYVGNRFMIYSICPDISISVHVLPGLEGLNTVLAVGKSIFRTDCEINIGEMLLDYGGGGHAGAGTCQVEHEEVDRVLHDILDRLGGIA